MPILPQGEWDCVLLACSRADMDGAQFLYRGMGAPGMLLRGVAGEVFPFAQIKRVDLVRAKIDRRPGQGGFQKIDWHNPVKPSDVMFRGVKFNETR